MKEKCRSIFKYFIPKFEELELWSMGLSLILTSSVNYQDLCRFLSARMEIEPFSTILMSLLAFCAIYFSMVHALINARKGPIEKAIMLRFAVLFTFIVSGICGVIAFKKAEGMWLLFPGWNLLNAFKLLAFDKFEILDIRDISDENTTGAEVFISSILVCIAFGVSNYILKNNWAITLSMCMAYSCNLTTPTLKLFTFWLPIESKNIKSQGEIIEWPARPLTEKDKLENLPTEIRINIEKLEKKHSSLPSAKSTLELAKIYEKNGLKELSKKYYNFLFLNFRWERETRELQKKMNSENNLIGKWKSNRELTVAEYIRKNKGKFNLENEKIKKLAGNFGHRVNSYTKNIIKTEYKGKIYTAPYSIIELGEDYIIIKTNFEFTGDEIVKIRFDNNFKSYWINEDKEIPENFMKI